MIKRVVNKHDNTRHNVYNSIKQNTDGGGAFHFDKPDDIEITMTVMDSSLLYYWVEVTIPGISGMINGEIFSIDESFTYKALVDMGPGSAFLAIYIDRTFNGQRNYPRFKWVDGGPTKSTVSSIEVQEVDGSYVSEANLDEFVFDTNDILILFRYDLESADGVSLDIGTSNEIILPRVRNDQGPNGLPGIVTFEEELYVDYMWDTIFGKSENGIMGTGPRLSYVFLRPVEEWYYKYSVYNPRAYDGDTGIILDTMTFKG